MFLYSIQQNSKQFHIKSGLIYSTHQTRTLHFNTGRVRVRPALGAGGLKWSKRDTTTCFVRVSEGTSSAILLNVSHIGINGEYC